MRKVLRLYQKKAIQYALRVKNPAFFLDMRLGKTLIAIRYLKIVRAARILVVCPYSAFDSWREELQSEELAYIELTGTRKERKELFGDTKCFDNYFLINKEGFLSLPEINYDSWDAVILDESTFIKNPTTKISKFFTGNFLRVGYRIIMTGTPAPESELNYYQQMRFLNPDILQYSNFWNFRLKCFKPVYFSWRPTEAGKKFIQERLAKYCFFLKRSEVNIRTKKIYQKRFMILNAKAKVIYKKICKEFSRSDNEKTIYATTKFIWLRQLTGGFDKDSLICDAKLKEVKYLMQNQLKKEKVVIWCEFIREIHAVNKLLQGLKVKTGVIYGDVAISKRTGLVKGFKTGNIQVLIAQPACLKYGVNLSVSSTAIFYSTTMSSETRRQAEDRLIDVDKKEPNLIIDLIVENTIDQTIAESMAMKESREVLMRRLINEISTYK